MQIQPLHLLLPQTAQIPSLSEVFIRAKDDFREYMARGWYHETAEQGFYIYRIESGGRQHTGILALNDVSDYKNGLIKKHEKTLATREAEYHLLLRDWRAVIKPVLMTYPSHPVVATWIDSFISSHQPLFSVAVEQEQHVLWQVRSPEDINALQQLFATEVPAVYIADGHHRTSTIANFSDRPEIAEEGLDFRCIFCAYFADDQLDILGYHRVLRLDEQVSTADFLEKLKSRFPMSRVDDIEFPAQKRQMLVVANNETWSLDFSGISDSTSPILDATLLNDLILSELAGIQDVRKDKRIVYSEGSKGITGVKALLAQEQQPAIGFILFPVSFEDLFYISDQGESLPPKSTWFEPRIKSGLMVQSLDF